jgi:purine-nucleoside phosphorylase
MSSSIERAAESISARHAAAPDIALILGSGLGDLAGLVERATAIPFGEIPGFPGAAVAGHAGRLVLGMLAGASVAVLQGRFHMYEGYDAATVALPTRVMLALGARTLIVTNAAGGINRTFRAGDLMVIDDHINLMFRNPLTGAALEGETRFPDMSRPYDPALQQLAERVAMTERIRLVRGVYAGLLGPTYETPAEVRMLERLGADAVGMSTVPESIAARARGVPVLGISLISNAAAGYTAAPLSHEEVVAAGVEVRERFTRLVLGVIAGLTQQRA